MRKPENRTRTEVVCVGQIVADCVGATIDELPRRGTLEIVRRVELHVGGSASNTAIALAKLGASVELVARAGTDGFGDFAVNFLAKSGVGVGGVVRDAITPTAATIVTVHSDAERSFLHTTGANAVFSADDIDWNEIVESRARILHVASPQLLPALEGEGLTEILREAKRIGLMTTMDTAMNPQGRGWLGIESALPFLDWAVPSEEEAAQLTGKPAPEEQARTFRDAGAKNVAIKLGVRGCYVQAFYDTGGFRVPALSVADAEVVDTLGAGDCWTAGFLFGLVRGWSIPASAYAASATGAACVRAYGATTGVRTMAETLSAVLSDEDAAQELNLLEERLRQKPK